MTQRGLCVREQAEAALAPVVSDNGDFSYEARRTSHDTHDHLRGLTPPPTDRPYRLFRTHESKPPPPILVYEQ